MLSAQCSRTKMMSGFLQQTAGNTIARPRAHHGGLVAAEVGVERPQLAFVVGGGARVCAHENAARRHPTGEPLSRRQTLHEEEEEVQGLSRVCQQMRREGGEMDEE